MTEKDLRKLSDTDLTNKIAVDLLGWQEVKLTVYLPPDAYPSEHNRQAPPDVLGSFEKAIEVARKAGLSPKDLPADCFTAENPLREICIAALLSTQPHE